MKYLLVILLLVPANAMAIDGEISFGAFFDGNTNRSAPGLEEPPLYYSSLKIGEDIKRLRVWTELITLMDEQTKTSFHPSSIEYKIGANLDIWEGVFLDFEHSCWHSIDTSSGVEQYNLIKLRYKF